MNRRTVYFLLLAGCACVALSVAAGAADLVQTHDPLLLNVGLGGWGYDTDWIGVDFPVFGGGVYVRLAANIGGTVLNVGLNGQGKLTYPTGVNKGDLWFQGATNGGVVSQDLGIELTGKYKIVVVGIPYEGNLPVVPNADIRLADSETFTPYKLGQSVTLSDSIQNQELYTYHIGVQNIFSGDIGVSLSASDTIRVDFKELHTDKASFTADLQRKQVSVPGATLAVGDIYENLGLVPSMTFTPNITVGITVLFIPYHITIPTFPITVPLASLLNPEYPTTPPRSIVFPIPPTVLSLAIANGTPYVMGGSVTLNNVSSNTPSDYMASENADFSGASWWPYQAAPTFGLSAGDGVKTVFFKTRNGAGESAPVSDTITRSTVLPTVTILITQDNTPALTGTVGVPTATLLLTVAGQAAAPVNNGNGTWTLADNILAPIRDGVYNVSLSASDSLGNTLNDTMTDELTIVTPPPTVNTLLTKDNTPELTGTVAAPTALLSLSVAGQTVTPTNHADGTWALANNTLTPIADGTYDVSIHAGDAIGNSWYDSTTDELTVDTTPPTLTVDALSTKDTMPHITGTVSHNTPVATVTVLIYGRTYVVGNSGGTWAVDVTDPLPENVYDVQAHATDAAGNVGSDTTGFELVIDLTPPEITVDSLATPDVTPTFGGTVNEPEATVVVVLNGHTYSAVNNHDGSWTVPGDTVNTLADGVYDVQATATDPLGNARLDATTNELRVDTTPPVVTVNRPVTNDTTPPLSGTVTDATATTILVTVAGQTLAGINNGNGTWTLPDNSLSPLAEGIYDVQVMGSDVVGNDGFDTTVNELTIDLTAPVVTVNTLITNQTSPRLTGAINDWAATVTVTVGAQTSPAVNRYGENTWELPADSLAPLAPGTYDVQVTARDSAGNVSHDITTQELTIDTTPPAATYALLSPTPTGADSIVFRVTFTKTVAPTFTAADVMLTGTLTGTVAVAAAPPGPVYTVTVTPGNSGANGALGIRINPGTVSDPAGNSYAGGTSPQCTVQNWCGFSVPLQSVDLYLYVDDSYTLSVAAGCGAGALAYQWKWDDEAKTVHDGPASTAWLLAHVTSANQGRYWCGVTYDGVVHDSEPAFVAVEQHLAITQQPQGDTKNPGESHTFSVATQGGYWPVRYAWKKGGVAIPSATNSEYVIGNLSESDSGVYTVAVADGNTDQRESVPATLTIAPNVALGGIAWDALLIALVAAVATRRALRRTN